MKYKIVSFLLLVFLLHSSFRVAEQPSATEEYSIKAAFIYKFTNYVEWENNTKGDEFVIGIIGSSPIQPALREIARTKTIKNKKIVIREYATPEDIGQCQVLFISQRCPYSLFEILGRVPRGVLTIGEKTAYCALGTGINFVVVDDRLKFEANPKVITESGLSASSQLLKLAIIVN